MHISGAYWRSMVVADTPGFFGGWVDLLTTKYLHYNSNYVLKH